jgi:multidrug resistance efflux pump
MFSAKLERQKRFHRLAILVAATVFATGVVLIAIWSVRASSMLTTADADRAPIIIGVLIALAGLFALCLVASNPEEEIAPVRAHSTDQTRER